MISMFSALSRFAKRFAMFGDVDLKIKIILDPGSENILACHTIKLTKELKKSDEEVAFYRLHYF